MPEKHCPICGRFMEEKNSRRWEHKWECKSCGIAETKNRIERDEWFPNVKYGN